MRFSTRHLLAGVLLVFGDWAGTCAQATEGAAGASVLTSEREIVRQLEAAVASDGAQAGLKMLQKKLAAEPSNLPARFFLATAYDALGNPENCIRTAREGIEMNTVDDRLLGILWVCFDVMGQTREAMQTAEDAVRQFPESAESHRWLGISNFRAERLEQSTANFERSLVLDPADSTSLYMLAQAYRISGFVMPSVLTYLRFLTVEPTGRRAVKARAQLNEILKPSLEIAVSSSNLAEISLPVGGTASKDETEFGPAKRALGIYTSPSNAHPVLTAERLAKGLDAAIGALPAPESNGTPKFIIERVIPHFLRVREAGHLRGLAEIVLLEGDAPSDRSIAFLEWATSQTW